MITKTELAVSLVEQGKTVRQAAREADVSETAVHSALKKRRAAEAGVCPTCGQAHDAAAKERQRIIAALQNTIQQTEGAEKRAYFQAVVDWLEKQ